MAEEQTKNYPAYKGDGVAIWKNTDVNNNTYLSVSILGGKAVNCFKFVPKIKPADTV